MFRDETIFGRTFAAQQAWSAAPRNRLARMKQHHVMSRLEEPSCESVLGTSMKMVDLLLLTFAMCAVTLPFYFAHTVHDPASFWAVRVSLKNVAVLAVCALFWTSILHSVGVYEPRRAISWRNLMLRLYTGVGICSVVTLAMLHFRKADQSIVVPLLIFFGASYALTATARTFAFASERYIRPHLRQTRRAIIVGTDVRSEHLAYKLSRDRDFYYDIVGFLDPVPKSCETFAGRPILGIISDLEHLLMREHIDDVLVALPVRSFYEEIRQVLQLCESSGVRSQYFSDLFDTSVTKRRQTGGDNAERVVLHMVHDDLRLTIKRFVDMFGALFGLIVLSPLFLLIAIAIKCTSPGPVFYSQIRYGLNKRRFPMFKFRSMVPDAEQQQAGLEHLNESDGPVFKIRNDPRITPVGRLLRKTSLDELPQLWNVLRGEMSLVGPRPLPMRDVSNFSELSLVRRFSVKPGMTGLWQVSGRSDTSFDGWVKLDLHYIDHWSLLMDARILMRTFPVVVRGSGAS